MVNIAQNYAEAVYYWHNSTGIYAGCTGERGVNLRTGGTETARGDAALACLPKK